MHNEPRENIGESQIQNKIALYLSSNSWRRLLCFYLLVVFLYSKNYYESAFLDITWKLPTINHKELLATMPTYSYRVTNHQEFGRWKYRNCLSSHLPYPQSIREIWAHSKIQLVYTDACLLIQVPTIGHTDDLFFLEKKRDYEENLVALHRR